MLEKNSGSLACLVIIFKDLFFKWFVQTGQGIILTIIFFGEVPTGNKHSLNVIGKLNGATLIFFLSDYYYFDTDGLSVGFIMYV